MEYFIYNIDTLTDTEYEKWFSLMTEEKQEKVNRYKDINRKKSSVAGEKLVKEHIGNALNIKPEGLVILTDKTGKPYIENCPIHFNISHCDNTLLCAFSYDEIGADIEKIRPTSLSVAKQFFSDEEQKYIFGYIPTKDDLNSFNDPLTFEKFYRIYTLKEAICKKSGIGIKGLREADALLYFNCSFKKNNYIISIV